MTTKPATTKVNCSNPEALAYANALIDSASALRMPDFFQSGRRDMIYRVVDRQGVSVVAMPSSELNGVEILNLMKYRLAQYLACNFVDPQQIHKQHAQHEPLSHVSESDVHIVAGCTETGEILCYSTLKGLPESTSGVTLRARARKLFPVEQVHGWGVYNRAPILPEIKISRIREVGRYVKNHALPKLSHFNVRGPLEVMAAFLRTLIVTRSEMAAVIGDYEENVARRSFIFFEVPHIMIHGTAPHESESSYLFRRYQNRTVYPFAILVSDLYKSIPRLEAIEQCLNLPGKQVFEALSKLPQSQTPQSSLERIRRRRQYFRTSVARLKERKHQSVGDREIDGCSIRKMWFAKSQPENF